jgi:hypothetical protein
MAMLGLGTPAGGRRRTRRGGGYYGKGGIDPLSAPSYVQQGGRRRTLKAKTLRRMLKKKGMKTTGKKATLMKRLHLKGGGVGDTAAPWDGSFDRHGLGGTDYNANIRGF